MTELLLYAERAGLENMRGHKASADDLAKEANLTLTVLLAVSSGALAYSVKLAEIGASKTLLAGMIATTAYLFVCCALLINNCLMIGEFPSTTNEPENLYQSDFTIDQIREAELQNLQARINAASRRNATTATWLNRVRLAATVTPIVLLIAITVAWAGCPF